VKDGNESSRLRPKFISQEVQPFNFGQREVNKAANMDGRLLHIQKLNERMPKGIQVAGLASGRELLITNVVTPPTVAATKKGKGPGGWRPGE